MMINEYLAKVRHAELLAEAERNHRFALAKNKKPGNISPGARLLVFIGGLLRRWGTQIEERFEAGASVNHARAADHG